MAEPLSLVGLGKLGLCVAACFAEKGFETIGVDIEERVVNSVNQGNPPWFEPRLDDFLARHGGKTLRATLHHHEAIEQTDITFVLVATPSNPDGSFSNRFIESALRSLSEALRESKKEHHLFVISSTVMPGSIESSFIPLIEKHSGRQLNQDFSVCYIPDFVALGSIINDFLHPEIVVIGETRPEAGERMETVYRQLYENEPYIRRMSITSAEIAKVMLNAYVTMKISFANALGNICERIPEADVDAITQTIGRDKRISPHYFQAGLSFGGTCFPRDTRAYLRLAEQYGFDGELIKAVANIDAYQDIHLVGTVFREVEQVDNKTIGILGVAFKPNTPVITESPAIKLIKELLNHNLRMVAYDPLATDNVKVVFNDSIECVSSAEDCLAESGVCVVAYRSSEFVDAIEKYSSNVPITIVDPWRILDTSKLSRLIKHVPLGIYFGE